MRCDERKPNPLDAAAILRALADGTGGEQATWLLVEELGYERKKLPPEVRAALAEAVTAHLAAGHQPEGEPSQRGAARFVVDKLAADPEGWLATARRHFASCSDPRRSPALAVLSGAAAEESFPVEASLIERIAREVIAAEGLATGWWEDLGVELCRRAEPGALLTLGERLLEAGDVRCAGVVLGMNPSSGDEDAILLLARVLASLQSNDEEAASWLAHRIWADASSDPWSPGYEDGRPLRRRAERLREVATRSDVGAEALRRIAGWLEAEANRRDDSEVLLPG
jgi:hypothetical protein